MFLVTIVKVALNTSWFFPEYLVLLMFAFLLRWFWCCSLALFAPFAPLSRVYILGFAAVSTSCQRQLSAPVAGLNNRLKITG
jgi:hypothetical protein